MTRLIAAVIAFLVLLASTIYLAMTVITQKNALADLRVVLREQRMQLALSEVERSGFENLLTRIDLNEHEFVAGYDVVADSAVTFSSVSSGIIYLMDSRCSACSVNIPVLNALNSNRSKRTIIAISFADDSSTLAAYAKRHGISFPALIAPVGDILRVAPRHATPVTVVIDRGRVVSYITGRIDDATANSLRDAG